MRSQLRFEKYRLLVRLGWSEDERRIPQAVDVSFTLMFKTPPAACQSDHLNEAVCYAGLADVIRECAGRQSFNLIEALGAQIHAALKKATPPDTRLIVEATKVSPPIAGLAGGVTFTYGDDPW